MMSASEQNANIRFVKEVQKHPTLYNFELPSYTRKDVTDEAWENVGRAMKMTPSACRERWRNLRAVFMRTMRAPPTSTGKKKPYYLSEVMQFVLPFMRPIARAEAARQKQRLLAKQLEDSQIPEAIEPIKLELPDDESCNSSEQDIEEEREIDTPASRKRPAQDEVPHQVAKVPKIAQPPPSPMPLDSDHVKSFLNSLLPELTEMNSAQFKNFKRRVLLLIDDIVSDIPAAPRRLTDDEYIM